MAIPDTQLGLLATAAAAVTSWQQAAQAVDGGGLSIQQVVFEFPPVDQNNLVQLTWDAINERFDIATLP